MVLIENYIPLIKHQGLNTAKNAYFSGTVTIVGTPLSTAGTIYPKVSPSATVVAKTTTGNLAAGDYSKNITNTGAGAGIVLTLLAAASAGISCFRVYLTVAQTVTLTPQTGEKIYLAGSGVASKYALIAGVIGNYVDVYCDGTDYFITGYSGVVTKEA